jgi:hypothetical protein
MQTKQKMPDEYRARQQQHNPAFADSLFFLMKIHII